MSAPHDATAIDLSPPRLVGRDRECQMLDGVLQSARTGRSQFVLVSGEIGIGKTALIRQVLADHSSDRPMVFTARAHELVVAPPLLLWRDLLQLASEALVNPAGEPPLADDIPTPLDQLIDWIAAVTRDGPVVLILEDIHWADAESLELLRQFVWRIRHTPALIVATYRDVDIGRGHPLYQLLPALLRETDAVHLMLRRLDREATSGLVAAAQPLTPADLDRLSDFIYAAGQGNPLASHELLRALRDAGMLTPGEHESPWQLGVLDRPVVPPLIRQIVDGRVDQLGDDGRSLIEIAAVIGEAVPAGRYDLWRDLTGMDETIFRETIDRAIELYVLTEENPAREVRFYHPLGRDTLYDGVGPLRRQVLHRRIGAALAESSHPDVDEVAFHLYQARDPAGVDWLVRAAEQAQRLGVWANAAARFEEAVELARATRGPDSTVGWLVYRAALMWRFTDLRRALEMLDDANAIALTTGDNALAVGTRYHRGFVRCWARQVERGVAEMAAAVDDMGCLTDDEFARLGQVEGFGSRERAERAGALVAWYSLIGRYRDALALSDGLTADAPLAPAGRLGVSRSAVGDAYTGRAISLAMLGEPEQTPQLFEAARQAYVAVGHYHQVGWSYLDELLHVALPYQADDLGRREWLVQQAANAWERSSPASSIAPAAIAELPLQVIEGDWRSVRDTGTMIDRSDRMNWITAPALAAIAIQSVDRQLFTRAVSDLLPAGADTAPGSTFYRVGFQLFYLSALSCALWGEPENMPRWLDAMDRWLDWSGAVSGQAELAVARAVYAFATAQLADLDRYANEAVRLASTPRQPLVLTVARRLLARSLIHAGQPVDARRELDASIALARACHNRLEEAIGMVMSAELQKRDGDRIAAKATLDDAVVVFTEIGAVSWSSFVGRTREWWGLADGASKSRPLSRRETEVLRLVANGLTDGDVAERLSVSRRTVTTHLSSIYRKLGVSSRAAATRIAVERHLI